MKNKAKIFIPFLDGVLSYNCRKCGYGCCQSGNLIMNAREKTKLIQLYPALRYFFTQETKKTYGVRKYPRCWFLEDSGLCSIQKKHGYTYKPFICRLHPFYIARCKDEYIVVPEICSTLQVAKGNKGILRKKILENAQQAVDYGNIHAEIDWPIKRLALEKEILAGSKAFLGNSNYLDFAAYQISISTENLDLPEIKSKLLDSINLWKSFLQADGLNLENKRLTYELIAYTSLLRLESLQLRQMPAEEVPLALSALYFYTLLFTKTRKPKTYAQTYQQILSDISLGLLYLKNDDLKIKDIPLENRIRYLRQLQMLHNVRQNENKIPHRK